MMVGVATAVMAAFLPDRQQSARRGSRRNGGGDGYGYAMAKAMATTTATATATLHHRTGNGWY